ncbi:aminoglycoside phosphotransferase family protein [Kribbella sp. NPDC050820]|uniref:phosphotransferase family protein n=1 Tax=Kribbella sp. NPDC050820 TaxID=3155408 RepID=UPI00340AD822
MHSDVRRLVGLGLPGYVVETVTTLGAGLDNAAYEVNRELVVRVAREPGVVRREAELLEWVGKVSTLPVPQPVFVLPEDGCLAYRKLDGTPLIDLPPDIRSQCAVRVAAELGGLLAVLHAQDVEQLADLVDIDDEPLDAWRDEAAESYTAVASELTPDTQRAVEAFLQSPLPAPPPRLVYSHNDLGIEHVLVNASTYDVSGVIDWTDAAICDPARDLGLILRDLGPAAYNEATNRLSAAYATASQLPADPTADRPSTDAAAPRSSADAAAGRFPADAAVSRLPADATANRLAGYAAVSRLPVDEGLLDRAWFYARCSLLEDLQYGLGADRPTYVEKSRLAADWLFTYPTP